jgi:hypothetical protein
MILSCWGGFAAYRARPSSKWKDSRLAGVS